MCHSQIEGDKDEQDRDEQEMKEREIFGSSSLSKLRQKNRLIFAFMLKVLNFFLDYLFPEYCCGTSWKSRGPPLQQAAMPSCPFSSFSYPRPPSSSRPLRSEILEYRNVKMFGCSACFHGIIVISIFEVRFFFHENLGEKYKCPWRRKNLLL